MPKLRHVLPIAALVVAFTAPPVAPVTASTTTGTGLAAVHAWRGPQALGRSLVAAPLGLRTAPRLSLPAAPACDGGFNAVSTPTGPQNNEFFATAALSSTEVWAVGINNASSTTPDVPMTQHWNGSGWSNVAVPNPAGPGASADLNGVSGASSTDVWAVGAFNTDLAGDSGTFAEHWDGSSWSLPAAQPLNPSSGGPAGTNINLLFAVTAISATDVVAVGAYYNFGTGTVQTLVEQWNGAAWIQIPSASPNTGGLNQLFSVSAFSATDIWAVGSQETILGSPPLTSLAEHWDGLTWSVVNTPNMANTNEIAFVNALEAGHAVGVGYGNFLNGTSAAQSEAWDLVTSPGVSTNSSQAGPGTGDNILEGVDRSGAGLWAVGFSRATPTSPRKTMVRAATWNASTHTLTWGSLGTSASPSTINNVLFTVSAVSPYTFWGAGYDTNSSGLAQTFIEGYCALHFSATNPPACEIAGSSFSITVSVLNGSNAVVPGYRGTVHFASSDGSATLPSDYTFTAGDGGTHTFTATLRTPGAQTITVSDIAMPLTVPVQGNTTVTKGACQAPAGTPGGRNITQSPPGTPGPRVPSAAGSPNVRTAAQNPAATTGSSQSQDSGAVGSLTGAQPAAVLLALATEFFTA